MVKFTNAETSNLPRRTATDIAQSSLGFAFQYFEFKWFNVEDVIYQDVIIKMYINHRCFD